MMLKQKQARRACFSIMMHSRRLCIMMQECIMMPKPSYASCIRMHDHRCDIAMLMLHRSPPCPPRALPSARPALRAPCPPRALRAPCPQRALPSTRPPCALRAPCPPHALRAPCLPRALRAPCLPRALPSARPHAMINLGVGGGHDVYLAMRSTHVV